MNAKPISRLIGDYRAEQLIIDSIRSRLTVEENLARDFIMDLLIDRQQPCPWPQVVEQLHRDNAAIEWDKVISSMRDKKVVVVGEGDLIEFVYPVSAYPTSHVVTLDDGRSFFAMCAVDALGSAYTFNRDVVIESVCAECGKIIVIGVNNGGISSLYPVDVYVLHSDLSCSDNWAGSS